jgi:hypothetical protein
MPLTPQTPFSGSGGFVAIEGVTDVQHAPGATRPAPGAAHSVRASPPLPPLTDWDATPRNTVPMDVLWADGEIESLAFEYDAVRMTVRETTGQVVVVECAGPVGFELLGMWDELVVEDGAVMADDEFARQCWHAVRARCANRVPDSGSPSRNTRSFRTLVVKLADGAELRVAAAAFRTRRA